MKYTYKTKGVCARSIEIDVENGVVESVQFIGGCQGNTTGISALVKGMRVENVIAKLKSIRCGFKSTSCPDQLAIALEEISKQ